MNRPVIRVNDLVIPGGAVLTGSNTMIFDGRKIARKGDLVRCEEHGIQTIDEGDTSFTDNGIPVALDGHACTCGCKLRALERNFTIG